MRLTAVLPPTEESTWKAMWLAFELNAHRADNLPPQSQQHRQLRRRPMANNRGISPMIILQKCGEN